MNFQYEVSPDEFQGVIAERMQITPAGALLFTNTKVSADGLTDSTVPVLAVAPGRWLTAFPEE